jgi:hypothetical protein
MWNLFGIPADKTSNTRKLMSKSNKMLSTKNQISSDLNQTTKIPQNDFKKSKNFNDKTQKSLFKINLFIKRFFFSYDPKKIDYVNEKYSDGSNYKR